MAVTVESFTQTFDEFRKADRASIEAKLALAKLQVTESVWGNKTDLGVLYLTAHMVALAPSGMNMKLKPESNQHTIYWPMYRAVQRQVTFGLRTAGLLPPNALKDPING